MLENDYIREIIMQRTLYAYKIEAISVNEEKCAKLESIENDMLEVLEELCKKSRQERKYDVKTDHKILYLDSYQYDAEQHILNMVFKSAKYNAVRNVINTSTMVSKGILKEPSDGDEEMNHVSFRFVENKVAVCLFEYNYYGIGYKRILFYIQHNIKQYHREKKDKMFYNLISSNVISNEFLEALEKVKRIKMVTLTVDQEDISVSETKALSGRADLSNDVNIVLKPAAEGASIRSDTVKDFYKNIYKKDKKVKRITVDADPYDKVPLTFDTEKMKRKIVISVNGTGKTNEVETRSMFEKLSEEIILL